MYSDLPLWYFEDTLRDCLGRIDPPCDKHALPGVMDAIPGANSARTSGGVEFEALARGLGTPLTAQCSCVKNTPRGRGGPCWWRGR